jgi:hypothetical protein
MGTMMANKKSICLACGVFKLELEALVYHGLLDFDIITLESMLHMKPSKLEQVMDATISSRSNENILLLYGDCHPRMHEMQNNTNVTKVAGMNCCDILLGPDAYRKLQKEKTFIFLPEWTLRWQEVFTYELGFEKPENARNFMKEHLSKLVYIDTGVSAVPEEALQEITAFFDMPFEVLPITLEILCQRINDAMCKLNGFQNNEKQ